MSDDPRGPPPRRLFGRITAGNVHATISRVAIAWAVVVAVQIFEIWVNFDTDQLPGLVVAFHLWSAAGAYFLWTRKSRAVAIAQFAYVILVFFTALIPYVRDGTLLSRILGLLLSIFMVGLAGCGVYATWVHHRAANLRTEWKHVALILGLLAIVIPCIVGAVAAMDFMYPDADKFAMRHAVEAALASIPLAAGVVTWKFPFARRDTARDVVAVFE